MFNIILKTIFIFFSFISASYAYIGPGMAGGVIAAIIGVIVSLFLALFGILYYPIKRALRKQRSNKSKNVENKNSRQDLESD